ncbi:MAG: hypothetical protein Q8Q36_01890 [bacterium]|nr:hypothetical protein [bacterium]
MGHMSLGKELGALLALVLAFFVVAFIIPAPLTAPETPGGQGGAADYAATGMLAASLYLEGKTLGVAVTPLQVLEDSRCPVDATCIQAGTVRVKVRVRSALTESIVVMAIGDAFETESEKIEFVDAEPPPRAGVSIPPADYIFNFKILRKVGGEF